MKGFLKKLHSEREGATLITVVIATAFLIAIGVIILAISSKYLVSVYMDRNANENLYDAEGVLSELRSGLMEYAGESSVDAYKTIVENYETVEYETVIEDGVEKKKTLMARDRFARMYIEGIITRLTGITPEWKVNVLPLEDEDEVQSTSISVEKLKELAKEENQKFVTTRAKIDKAFSGGADDDENKDLTYEIYKSPTKGYFLILRGIVINYQKNGYNSTIQTDIQINVPDYKFNSDDSIELANDYLLISDGKLLIDGDTTRSDLEAVGGGGDTPPAEETEGGASFTGNIYTGGDVVDVDTIKNPGIVVEMNREAHFNCEKLISRGSFEAYTGSKVSITGPEGGTTSQDSYDGIYLKNIKLLPSNVAALDDPDSESKKVGTDFTLKANTYVENDLDIQDSGSTVTLGGIYSGFSYNAENDITDLTTSGKSQSDYSSAILINGISTTLKADDLKSLRLSGRSYVSRGEGENSGIDAADDIMMGESLSVRSNQIAYLVPDKYVVFEHNPVLKTEADDEGLDYFTPNDLVKINQLKSSDIGEFLDEDNPVTGNYGQAEGIIGDSYVFLYLNFKDQVSANKYFQKFYFSDGNGNQLNPGGTLGSDDGYNTPGMLTKDDLVSSAKSYVSSKDGNLIFDSGLSIALAGNIIYNYYQDGGPAFQSANYFDDSDKPSTNYLLRDHDIGIYYVNYQKSLTPDGKSLPEEERATSMRLVKSPRHNDSPDSTKVKEYVKETFLDFDQLAEDDVVEIPIGENRIEEQTGAKVVLQKSEGDITVNSSYLNTPEGSFSVGRCLLVTVDDVSIDSDCEGLIIAKGNVDVKANFSGLIVAGGSVTVSMSKDLKSDPVLVKKLLSYAQSDPALSKVFRGVSEPDTHNTKALENCFKFLNWEKNSINNNYLEEDDSDEDSGSADGGSADGGSADGGSADGGSTDGGSGE